MAELGDQALDLHREAGFQARQLGITRLYATGELSRAAVQAFGAGGTFLAERDALVERLRRDLGPGVTLLVKGSRSMAMEQVVEALEEAD